MAVSEQNTRILVTISKETKNKLKILSSQEQRSVSNLCSKIINDYIKSKEVESLCE